MWRYLYDVFVLLSVIVWILSLAFQGYIPPQLAALAILILVVSRALARGHGGNFSRLVRQLFSFAVPIASLAVFVIIYSGGDVKNITSILSELLTLGIVILGIYIMFLGVSRRR